MGPTERSDAPLKGRWNPEQDPLAELGQGDTSTFEAFVRDQTPVLRAFFRRLGAPPSEADDLVQDTYLKLYRNAATYEPQGRFLPFAFRVARNAWIDRQRRRMVRPSESQRSAGTDGMVDRLSEVPSASQEPHAGAAQREEVRRLRTALALLSEGHRLVFELGVLQELPYADISVALSIPVGTVKSRMYHAVRKLRAALEPEEDR